MVLAVIIVVQGRVISWSGELAVGLGGRIMILPLVGCWEPRGVSGACGLPALAPKPRGDQEVQRSGARKWYHQPIAASRQT